jgi:hypothetical protein
MEHLDKSRPGPPGMVTMSGQGTKLLISRIEPPFHSLFQIGTLTLRTEGQIAIRFTAAACFFCDVALFP